MISGGTSTGKQRGKGTKRAGSVNSHWSVCLPGYALHLITAVCPALLNCFLTLSWMRALYEGVSVATAIRPWVRGAHAGAAKDWKEHIMHVITGKVPARNASSISLLVEPGNY